jgi:cytochrome P450
MPPAVTEAPAGLLRLRATEGFRAPAARVADLPGPPAVPLLGNAHQLPAGTVHACLEQWAREYGPMYRFRAGAQSIVVLSDPILIGEILRHRPEGFMRGARLTAVIDEIGLAGVFTAEGDRWRRHRKLVMRALTPEAVRHFFPIIRTVTQRLLERWRALTAAGGSVEVSRDLKRYAIDVTTWLSMGVDVDTLNQDDHPLQGDVELLFETLGRRFLKPFPYWRWVRLPADRRADEAVARLNATIDDLIARARARMAADPALAARPSNILEALIAARDEPGSEFDDDDVRGNVGTMLFAGEDTAANAMAWLLMLLAGAPHEAAQAAREVDPVLAGEDLIGAFADLAALEYVEACAVESMRLRPIAPQNGATARQPADLAGLRIDPGQTLIMLTRPTGLDAARFPDPMVFRPERWLGEAAASADDTRRTLFPFGAGPRYCPGRYLAMVEIKMVVAMVLGNFRIAPDPAARVDEHFTFTMGPSSLPLRFTPR